MGRGAGGTKPTQGGKPSPAAAPQRPAGALQPIPGPSDQERDAIWARLLTELGFPLRCPRGACRRSRACQPANGVFACRIAHPEAFEHVKLGLARGRIAVATREP